MLKVSFPCVSSLDRRTHYDCPYCLFCGFAPGRKKTWRPCSECPSSYLGQTSHLFGTRMKKHKGVVSRQDENSLLTLHCLTTGHAFDWDRATVVGKGAPKYKREFAEAWNTTSTCVNKSMDLDPGYKTARILEETNAYTTTTGSLVPKPSCQHCITNSPPPNFSPHPITNSLISFHTHI